MYCIGKTIEFARNHWVRIALEVQTLEEAFEVLGQVEQKQVQLLRATVREIGTAVMLLCILYSSMHLLRSQEALSKRLKHT